MVQHVLVKMNETEMGRSLTDASTAFDAPYFNVEVGPIPSPNTIVLDGSDGFENIPTDQNLANDWAKWRLNGARDFFILPLAVGVLIEEDDTPNTDGRYCGTAASRWWNYHERMWHLLNLVRVLNNDSLVGDLRDEVLLDGPSLEHLGDDTIEMRRV